MTKPIIKCEISREELDHFWSLRVVSFWRATLIGFAITAVLMGIAYVVIPEWFPKIYLRKDELITTFIVISPLSAAFLSGGFWQRSGRSIEQISIHGISLGLIAYFVYFIFTAGPILGDDTNLDFLGGLLELIGIPESSLFIIVPTTVILLTMGLVYVGYFVAEVKKKSLFGMQD